MRTALFWAWPTYGRTEIAFWHALRDGLRGRGLRLVLALPAPPPSELDVDCVVMTTTPDAFWPSADPREGIPPALLGLEADRLLAREADWSGPALVPAIARTRREALDHLAWERISWLQTIAPAVTIIWNGQHAAELILAAASRCGGTPVMFAERAPVADAIFVDDQGLSTASAVAAVRPWPSASDRWRDAAVSLCRDIVERRTTWWEQPASREGSVPALRESLGIPSRARVVLFAGQVDEDTQNFLFSPFHRTNLDAFEWLLRRLTHYPDVFVLGKQHPRSRTPAARYRERLAGSGVPGAWREDVSIDNALAVADRVAAVNSTVLYEALAAGLPVLALGDWLLTGQGAAYEIDASPSASLARWWDAADLPARLSRWHEAFGYLLSRSIYSFDATGRRAGLLSAADLAARIARAASARRWRLPDRVGAHILRARGATPASWSPADSQWPGRRDALASRTTDWHVGQSLRHALLPAYDAFRQGRRVRVWGDAAPAHAAAQWLRASGVSVHGDRSGAPLHESPHATGPRSSGPPAAAPDFVLVAASHPAPLLAQLEAAGLAHGADISVVAPHLLDALAADRPAAGDAA